VYLLLLMRRQQVQRLNSVCWLKGCLMLVVVIVKRSRLLDVLASLLQVCEP
jgi:hypothetical protein